MANSLLDWLPGYASSRADFDRRTSQSLPDNLHEFVRGAPVIGPITRLIEEPSLGTATNAGTQTLLAFGQPLNALRVLGAGYGGAVASDLGLFGSLGAPPAEAKKSAKDKPIDVANLPGLSDEDNATYRGIMSRLSAGEFSNGAERRALESQAKIFTDKAGLAAQRSAELEAAKAVADKAEFDRQVGVAEAARDLERARDWRFTNTATGKMWQDTSGFGPFLAAAALSGLGRAVAGAATKTGDTVSKNVTAPLIEGALAGGASTNIPLAADAFFAPVANPEAMASAAYARELPDSHPKKQQAIAEAERLARTQPTNPVREGASRELYDPLKAIERMGFGIIEGMGGGLAGANLMRLPNALAQGAAAMPGLARASWHKSQALADAAMEARVRQQSPQGTIGGAGGNAQTPTSALPPAAPPNVLQDPPLPPTSAQSQRAVGYGRAQQNIARPLIDSEVGIGAAVPSANALENAYRSAGVKPPTTKKYTTGLNETQKLVAEMQSRGMSGPDIVAALRAMREQGLPVLGIGGAVAAPSIIDRGVFGSFSPEHAASPLWALDSGVF